MKVLILTGMSGSGKSSALKMIEDLGYYCLDNLPTKLMAEIVEMILRLEDFPQNLAITADMRNKDIADELESEISALKTKTETKVLYLDSDDSIILKRYKESRRLHPLMMVDSKLDLKSAIEEERHLMETVRSNADYLIDTTYLSSSQLREKICDIMSDDDINTMNLNFVAFGYKYGIPADADLVFDVRCLPNPFYIPEFRNMTGADREVRDFVMSHESSQNLMKSVIGYLECALPMYEKEGKAQLVVGLGCTGGQHRSLTFAILLAEYFEKKGYKTSGYSRDKSKNLTDIRQRDSQQSDKGVTS